jgi:hypothetical protein
MARNWKNTNNLVGLPTGKKRSVDGYAAESLVIGRALLCGYNLFFKAWRDSPYDAVLDHQGILFRIEVKGTINFSNLNVTGGGRSGQQIDSEAENREHVVSKNDCDFLIGTTSMDADCYVIPTEVLEILNRKTLTLNALFIFKEKWKIFLGTNSFSTSDIQLGFLRKDSKSLRSLCKKHNIPTTQTSNYPWEGVRGKKVNIPDKKKRLVLDIWRFIYKELG